MDERQKVEAVERTLAAWNRGDLDGVLAECTPDFEWDLRQSSIPGHTDVYRGREGYLSFANSWRETMGPTQLELEEACELGDGRLYVLILQSATGPRSGVDVDIHYVQILEFEGSKAKRCEVFGDQDEGRRAAGLDS